MAEVVFQEHSSRSVAVDMERIVGECVFTVTDNIYRTYDLSDDSTIVGLDNTVSINKTVNYKLDVINKTGSVVNSASLYFPIPKKGENWGAAINPKGAFTFNMQLNGDIKSALPEGYSVSYAVAVPNGNNLKWEDGTITWQSADQVTDWSKINFVRIIHETEIASDVDDVIQFDMSATADAEVGKLDVWRVTYRYQLSSSAGWATGDAVGATITSGSIFGTSWHDENYDSKKDASEEVIPGTVFRLYSLNNSGQRWHLIDQQTADENGNYAFNALWDEKNFELETSVPEDYAKLSLLGTVSAESTDNSFSQVPNTITGTAGVSPLTSSVRRNAGFIKPGYRIEFYYQNETDGSFPASPDVSEYRLSNVGTEINATAEDKISAKGEKYVFDENNAGNILQGTVNKDCSLVLKIYFKLQYSVTYEPGEHGTFENQKTEHIDYGAATPAAPAEITGQPGYTFTGWTPTVADKVTADAVYVAQWLANTDTPYKVEYYYQKNGSYSDTADSFVTRGGTTDSDVSATDEDKVSADPGYVFDEAAENILKGKISGDGSFTLKIYFKQQFTVIYQPGDRGTFEEEKIENLDYGSVTPDAPQNLSAQTGYVFKEWSPQVSETVKANAIYVAQWEAGINTPYKVECFYQKNGKYGETADKTITRYGTTDTSAAVTDEDKISSYPDFVFDEMAENILKGNIAGDGSLVLKLYFKQQFRIIYDLNGGKWADGHVDHKGNGPVSGTNDNYISGPYDVTATGVKVLSAVPVRDGYTLVEWKGSSYQPGDDYAEKNEDGSCYVADTLVAQWVAKEKPAEPTNNPPPSPNVNPYPRPFVNIVKTGDPANLRIYFTLMLASMNCLLICLTVLKKNRKSREQ